MWGKYTCLDGVCEGAVVGNSEDDVDEEKFHDCKLKHCVIN